MGLVIVAAIIGDLGKGFIAAVFLESGLEADDPGICLRRKARIFFEFAFEMPI
jgi:hypothetical protein